ncbi:MAG: IS1634 family transposase [Mycobacterium sp.]|uniref:IS1634 family transposase n=1 Tax=Mycobacterium sp. TaxID=1785 RepID=UPI002611934B|nr:IS1634 family transposase [Mycobacterium sp.]MDI3313047.1 IS1634 family transposase [Mycobacterium sp.]MDI3313367.1 IS1634 family transposase [Mycobacterium sp.]MDI3313431.1 IS1634 family transposase [Mycobacterium sp.]MDI3313577.1 IS1634 family transposase [Mycobacterium sp.]MDI3314150.1 IS1634 family transposase [Mycobacterium sp.]
MVKPVRMHVARTPSKYVDKAGNVHRYESVLVRRTYRDGTKVRHETLANLSKLPAEVIAAIEATLKGQVMVPAQSACTITRSLPHGHVAAVAAMARRLGFPALLGPACRSRDLVLGLVISRVIRPASKLSTLSRWADTTLGPDLDVAGASTDEVYAAMDWLANRQDAIEKKLAAKHLGPAANPSRMALFDLTSSWVTGRCCELAAHGYSRDGKKGLPQINYGVLTDPAGRPVAVRVFSGDTADPVAFTDIVEVLRDTFGLTRLVLVGDRGMITSARISALRELNTDAGTGFGWITALRAPQIATLAADKGPLQMSLFDTQDLAEIAHPDYPGERLIACRNPALAAERARKRAALLAATEADLAAIAERVARGTLKGAGKIGEAVGRIIVKHNVGKHFHRTITDTSFTYQRDQAGIDAEASLDGIYVLRTSVDADTLTPAAVVESYKNLAHVERDFRSIKADDLDLRPIHHRLDKRVRAHVLICLLACYLVWHLRKAWASLTFTDEHPPARDNPVAPAQRSPQAQAKASTQHDPDGNPLRSFRGLLDHLATLTRNDIHYHGTNATVPTLAEPTPDQRRAFDLIGTPIPLTAA